jgi:hypothetical protein
VYTPHPSAELTRLFRERPYQGADPATAKFLFVGLDANYAANIENGPVWQAVREYHEDGVSFWRRNGVHHPFLIRQYTGDGRRYHRSFSKIGFRPEHAHLVSFVELLPVPTVGRSKLSPEDFDRAHLERLRAWMFDGAPKQVFVTSDVLRLTRPTGVFPWLATSIVAAGTTLKLVAQSNGSAVFQYLHFSNYGKFQQQMDEEAVAIRALLPAQSE